MVTHISINGMKVLEGISATSGTQLSFQNQLIIRRQSGHDATIVTALRQRNHDSEATFRTVTQPGRPVWNRKREGIAAARRNRRTARSRASRDPDAVVDGFHGQILEPEVVGDAQHKRHHQLVLVAVNYR